MKLKHLRPGTIVTPHQTQNLYHYQPGYVATVSDRYAEVVWLETQQVQQVYYAHLRLDLDCMLLYPDTAKELARLALIVYAAHQEELEARRERVAARKESKEQQDWLADGIKALERLSRQN